MVISQAREKILKSIGARSDGSHLQGSGDLTDKLPQARGQEERDSRPEMINVTWLLFHKLNCTYLAEILPGRAQAALCRRFVLLPLEYIGLLIRVFKACIVSR